MDPLASLPLPWHDLDRIRTFPGRPEQGRVTWQVDADGALHFTTTLPRRYGDTGAIRRFGTFANGGWHPQPMVDGHLPQLAWDVTLTLPDDLTGAVGEQVGTGTLRWTGEGDRASLAAVRHGVTTEVGGHAGTYTLLTSGRPRPGLRRHLPEQLALTFVPGARPEAVIVQAPLRRRLGVAGDGLAYLSDRAWRVFPWFSRLHHPGAVAPVVTAAQPHPDPFDRAVAGASLSLLHRQRLARRQAVDLVGLTKWIPAVDNALYDQEMPFLREVFRRTHPTDRVADELRERLDPHAPADAAVAQLSDRMGIDAARRLGAQMALGSTLSEAEAAIDADPDWLAAFRTPYPTQDYTLDLHDTTVVVTRTAPDSGLPEPVVLDIDGVRRVLEPKAGPATWRFTLDEAPRRVALDPDGHLGQTFRVAEVRPPRLRWTFTGQIAAINVSQGFVDAFGVVTLRRSDDTYNRFRIWLLTSQREHLAGRFSYTRFFGPLLRGATRQHSVTFGLDAGWLNQRFATLDADWSMGGSVQYVWDNREYSLFPLSGSRVSLGVGFGGAPQANQEYASLSASIIQLGALHPRHVIAARVGAGAAFSDIPQRRLRFGGDLGVRGIPDDAVQTDLQAVGSLEYRVAALRNTSIPLGVLYISELDLTFGADAGVASRDGDLVTAASVSAGLGLIVENLGLSPGAVNLTFGVPLWWRGFAMPVRALPFELYLTWGQVF